MMCFGLKDRKRVKTNHCVIVLLDDTQLVHELHHSTSGQDLLDVVIKHLNLLETSYFGLKYLREPDGGGGPAAAARHAYGYSAGAEPEPADQHMAWLDVDRGALKQLGERQPMVVHFAVKFYASDPCKLAEEITRYQFFLQCKRDILHGRLPVAGELAVELLALAVQSELGDYDPQRHAANYVGEFHFLPNQTAELEQRAALQHRQLVGQVPATAELNFLERVKWLELYGCELHPIQYSDDELAEGAQFALALGPAGVLVLRNRHRVAQYAWPRIVKTKCQGRCFLMDVLADQQQQQAGGDTRTAPGGAGQRNRFGFRLRDKQASRRLRWSLEEHKAFFHLVHSSAALQQLAAAQKRHQRHQQATLERGHQLKLSQRFRNSLRSAIGFAGGPANEPHLSQKLLLQQQHHQRLAAVQQQQLLRSSVKSVNPTATTAARQPPTVVRMPSRRYNSNRSLARPHFPNQHEVSSYQADGLGPPAQSLLAAVPVARHHQQQQQQHSAAQTMLDSQRQQALLLMSQFSQMNAPIARSQTLKPASSREAKRNPYYQMMMMLTAQQHQAQLLARQQQHQLGPEVSILPAGQHIVQPSVYRASSVINGINQLGKRPADLVLGQPQPPPPPPQQQQQQLGLAPPTMGQQLFSGKPMVQRQRGHESPRSTKSAMAPSSALRLASRRLAKQQLIYGNQADLLPLLAAKHRRPPSNAAANYSSSADYYDDDDDDGAYEARPAPAPPLPYSANASPRSTRSARLATPRHRSRSTGENLHLLHQSQAQFVANNRMLLATAQPAASQQLAAAMLSRSGAPNVPPPDYNLASEQQHQAAKYRPTLASDSRTKRAAFAMSTKQANLLLSGQQQQQHRRRQSVMSDDDNDDYYCSRSDCSSVDNAERPRQPAAGGLGRPAQFFGGQQIGNANSSRDEPASAIGAAAQQDWNAIKRRHDQFDGAGKAQLAGEHNNDRDTNNNNNNRQPYAQASGGNLVKNIPNKQATPILLSMSYNDNSKPIDAASNKAAVKLLNLQRQQLNSQSSDGSCGKTGATAPGRDEQLGSSSSAASSAVSSPKAQNQLGGGLTPKSKGANAADSTGSSSTTSGYYAGSNSTGPTSVDSDTISGADSRSPRQQLDNWTQDQSGGRAKANSYLATRAAGGAIDSSNRFIIGNPQKLLNSNQQKINGSIGMQSNKPKEREYQNQQQHFYLPETNHSDDSSKSQTRLQSAHNKNGYRQEQWSPLEQIQQHSTSSLKYVSFDV